MSDFETNMPLEFVDNTSIGSNVDNPRSIEITDALDGLDKDQIKLLEYAREMHLTSDYAFKDYLSGAKDTDEYRSKNTLARESFLKLFQDRYNKIILKTEDGIELVFDCIKFRSNGNLYDLHFALGNNLEEIPDFKKHFIFRSGGKSSPIYQEYIMHYPGFKDGMYTQFKFDQDSRNTLEEMLSYSSDAELFQQYRQQNYK